MDILNILYTLILLGALFRFLQSDGRILKSPFNKRDQLSLTGPEMYWVLLFSTGLLAFSYNLGLDLMALRLFVIMGMCLVGFAFTPNRPIMSIPLWIYGAYMVWLLIGCVYASSFSFGVRVWLKYLYPLLFCLFGSAVVDNFATALKAALSARWVALITVIVCITPYYIYFIPGVIWYDTARIIHYISMFVFSLGLIFFSYEKKENILYSIVFGVPCFFYVLRTSILGTLIALIAFSLIRWRVKSLPIIATILLIGIGSIFYIPSLRSKMFFDDRVTIEQFQTGKVNMNNVNTNTRTHVWKNLEKNLYKGHEVLGSGTGACQEFMELHPKLFFGLRAVHSDFVQMKCDNGQIGLWLYCTMIAAVFSHCFFIYWKTEDNRIKLFAITAGASLMGIFATMYSDNTVNYSMATLSIPFGFYGMTIALFKRLKLTDKW